MKYLISIIFSRLFPAFSTTSLALPVDPATHLMETEKSTTAANEVEIRLKRSANTVDDWSSVLDMVVASEDVMSAAFQDYVSI